MPPELGWLPGTASGTEETRKPRLGPQLPLTRIRNLSAMNSPADRTASQRPSRHHSAGIRELAWVPGNPGLPVDSSRCGPV